MKKGIKITLGVIGALTVSVLAYLMFIKRDSKLYVLKGKAGGLGDLLDPTSDSDISGVGSGAETPTNVSPPSSGSGLGGFFGGTSTGNPFTDGAEVKAFQEYVLNVIKDTDILGSAGADGIWGSKTSKAYQKYGEKYHAYNNPQSAVMTNLNNAGIGYTKPSDESIRVVFDNNGYNYVARFYPNGRVVFYILGKSSHISKGNYSNGGKKIVIFEGRHKGKTFNNSSLLANLRSSIVPSSTTYTMDGAIGKIAKPKGNYATLRIEPVVDDAGIYQTRIGKINTPDSIGKITDWTKRDGHIWYYIHNITGTIKDPRPGMQNKKSAWVRSDVIKVV